MPPRIARILLNGVSELLALAGYLILLAVAGLPFVAALGIVIYMVQWLGS